MSNLFTELIGANLRRVFINTDQDGFVFYDVEGVQYQYYLQASCCGYVEVKSVESLENILNTKIDKVQFLDSTIVFVTPKGLCKLKLTMEPGCTQELSVSTRIVENSSIDNIFPLDQL